MRYNKKSFSQEIINVSLELKDNMLQASRFYKYYVGNISQKTTPLYLSNGEVSTYYSKQVICLNPQILKDDTISIISGVTKKMRLFIRTTNKTVDGKYTKDNYIDVDFKAHNDTDYYKGLKQIDIDSVRGVLQGKIIYSKYSFYGSIEKSISHIIKDSIDLKAASKGFLFCLLSNYYLEGFFKLRSDSFKVNIILSPRLNNFYKYGIDSSTFSLNILKVYKKIDNRYTEISFKRMSLGSIDSFSSFIFNYEGKQVFIKKINTQQDSLQVCIFDSAQNDVINEEKKELSPLGELLLFDVSTNKKFSINFNSNKKKYLLFTGSWCKPCHNVLTELLKNKKKFSKLEDIYVIDLERSITSSKNYLKAYPKEWNLCYEPFKNYNYSRLQQIFGINVFPTLLIISGNKIESNINGDTDVISNLKVLINASSKAGFKKE